LLVEGDRERLLQVLSNLLANAVKFAPNNGTITARAWAADGWVQFSVSDDGPGIGPGELERVFEPYWSGEPSSGTGLGLSIVKGIVEAHGGATSLESRPGRGTTVGFRLPERSGQRAPTESLMSRLLSRGPRPG
jgi:signal transduction histidine kinase